MPEFSFEPSDGSFAQVDESVATEALNASLEHLEEQREIPDELIPALLSAEVNLRVNNGYVFPVVQIDYGEDCYALPPGTVLIDFLVECLRRHAAHHVHCSLIDDDGNLVVVCLSKERAWAASCELERGPHGVNIGDWKVREEHPVPGARHSQAKAGRNAPCPCGSGRKFKKCCGSRRTRTPDLEADAVSEAEFARQLMVAVRRADATARVAYDPGRSVLLRDGRPYFLLENAFGEFRSAPVWHRGEILRKYVRVWFNPSPGLPKSFEDVQPDVLPSIVPRGRYENCLRTEKDRRIHTVVGEHLAVSLVYDHRDVMQHLSSSDLREWGVTKDEAFAAAMANLRDISLPPKFSMHIKGVFVSAYDDDYAASRLLLPEVIRRLGVQRDAIAMVPNRRTLIVADADDPIGLAAMADLAEQALDGPWPISGIPLRFRDGDWQSYQPPTSHPAYRKFRRLWHRSMSEAYSQQRSFLQAENARNGIEAFVGIYAVFPKMESPETLSLDVWPNGIPSLLCRADVLGVVAAPPTSQSILAEELDAFAHCGETLLLVWDDACSVLSDLMVKTDDYPERYLIRGKCDSARLARLRLLNRTQELTRRLSGRPPSEAGDGH